MNALKPSKTRATELLILGLVLAAWELREYLRHPEDPQFLFYSALYLVAFAVLRFAHALSEALWGMNGAFLVVFLGTSLRDLVRAVVYKSSAAWIVGATMLAMALLGLYWSCSARPWPAPGGDSGA